MARQKLLVSGEIVLPEGDIFEATDKARSARTILDQAQKEIQKTFPDFQLTFDVGMVRAAPKEGARTPGRKAGAAGAAAGAPNGGAAATA
jgi:hypothetical protein